MTELQNTIREILNREDIEGLLALGAPGDEYSTEAELISQAIENGQVEPREEELNKLLRGIWQRMFGPFSEEEMKQRQPALERVARQLTGMCLNGPKQ
jgi:hypothetical protein